MYYIRIDKKEKTPLYKQMAQSIELAIKQQILKHGDLLPTEKIISDAFNVSLKVPVKAYKMLVSKGLCRRYSGKGTFIDLRPVIYIDFYDFLKTETQLDIKYLLNHYGDISNSSTPNWLPEKTIQASHTLIYENFPLAYRQSYFTNPMTLEDNLLESNVFRIIYTTFKKHSIIATHHMSIINLDSISASMLQVQEDSPGFLIETDIEIDQIKSVYIKTFYSGNYVVWRDKLETIKL